MVSVYQSKHLLIKRRWLLTKHPNSTWEMYSSLKMNTKMDSTQRSTINEMRKEKTNLPSDAVSEVGWVLFE